jgi:hypothetical protein
MLVLVVIVRAARVRDPGPVPVVITARPLVPVRPAAAAPNPNLPNSPLVMAAPAPRVYGPDLPFEPEPEPPRKIGRVASTASPGLGSAAERRRLLEEAWSLLRAQRFDEARAGFSRLVERKPPPAGALLGLAQVAFQEHNYAEASKRAREGVRAGAGVEAYVVLGDAHFRLQQYAEARKAYAEALKLEPEHEAARRALVIVERQLH